MPNKTQLMTAITVVGVLALVKTLGPRFGLNVL